MTFREEITHAIERCSQRAEEALTEASRKMLNNEDYVDAMRYYGYAKGKADGLKEALLLIESLIG